MADVVISVDPQVLLDTAERIRSLCDDYTSRYEQLYVTVRSLKSAWKGKDNNEYTSRIEGYRDDYASMRDTLSQYADYIERAANAYIETERGRASVARKLIY